MPIHRTVVWSAAVAAAGAMLSWGGGCNIAGPAAYFVTGPEQAKPKYVLPSERTTVVFVDDRASRVPSRPLRERIGKSADSVLLDKKAVNDLISSSAPLAAVTRETFDRPTGIAEVGQSCGAEVVVYITVDQFGITSDNQTLSPASVVRVKVIDAATTERLWPADPEQWQRLEVTLPQRPGYMPTTLSERLEVEQALAEAVGKSVARLFVRWDPSAEGTRVQRGL